MQKLDTGEDITHFQAFCSTREVKKPEEGKSKWMTLGSELRVGKYETKYKESHGENSNPLTEPFDPEVAMLAGDGKKNGRLYVADGCVPEISIPSKRQLYGSGKGSRIETRPQPSQVMYSRMQVWSSSLIIQ